MVFTVNKISVLYGPMIGGQYVYEIREHPVWVMVYIPVQLVIKK